MNSKQLGLSEYNDIILSVYDANPVANISETIKKTEELATPEPEEKKPKKVGSNLLRKETYKLKLAAIANFKLTKRIFAYEKRRLKQLTVDFGKVQSATKSKEEREQSKKKKKEKKDQDTSIRGWIRKIIQDLLKNLKNKLKDSLKKFLRRRYIRNYKKLNPKQRARVRARKKFFDRQKAKYKKFIKRGGLRGFASRRLKRLGTGIIGKRNAARLRLFRQTGGVKGAVRRQFFKSTRGLVSTAKSIKGIAGVAFDTIRGVPQATTTAATQVASKAGRGVIVQTARNALVGTLGKSGTKEILKLTKNYISPLLKKIPIIGTLIDFALNVFVFKESLGKSAFKAIGAGLMAWLGGAIGSIIPVAGTVVGAALGGWAGDALGGLLYDAIFGGGVNAEASPPSDQSSSQLDVNQFSEGGKVPAKPQLVLVGEGGEEEFIIPKSKLSWFLGSDAATNAVSDSIGQLAGAVQGYLADSGLTGIASGAISGLSAARSIAKKTVKTGLRSIRTVSASNFIDKILEFMKDILNKVKELFQKLIPDLSGASAYVKNTLKWIAKTVGGPLVGLVDFMIGGPAGAATRPPQGPLGDDLDLTPMPVDGSPFINPTPKTNLKTQKGGYAADTGLDIHGNIGDPIVAPASGTLEYAEAGHTAQADQDSDPNTPGKQPQYSFRIKLDKPFTYQGKTVRFIYGTHLSSLDPSVANKSGIKISQGQRLGAMGQANGVPHLHLGLVGDREQTEFMNFQQVDALLGGRYAKNKNKPSPKAAKKPLSPATINNAIRTLGGDPNEELKVPQLTSSIAPLNIKDTASNLELQSEEEGASYIAMEPEVIIKTQYVPIPMGGGSSVTSSNQTSSSWLPAVLGA